jgi:enamine deaminase RidA (YjgF/YER057c/UK114 family)
LHPSARGPVKWVARTCRTGDINCENCCCSSGTYANSSTRIEPYAHPVRPQAARAFENVGIALEAAGAGWEHVVKWTGYIVDLDEAKMGEFFAGMGQAMERGLTPTAATLIGVQALYQPDLLIEIEAIAEI